MPAVPFLLFGFDVDRDDPDADAILNDVERDFPLTSGVGSTGLANAYVAEVPPSQAPALYRKVAIYLDACDGSAGGRLHWFVQLCRTPEFVSG